MSSDSGESQSSAHNDNDNDIQAEEQQELGSIDGGGNGLTFATRRRAQEDEEASESASELAIRSAVGRPGSPESTSTPDDTPSIQVGAEIST
jgi:hypothetical protein